MFHSTLRRLWDDEFVVDFGVLSSPRALHWALGRCEQVKQVEMALKSGEINEEEIRQFVGITLRSLKPGTLFPFDVSLAAVAVAIQSRPTEFVEQFLESLASLELAEIPMSVRVGRLARTANCRLPKNRFAKFDFLSPASCISDWQETTPFREPLVCDSQSAFAFGDGNA